MIVYKPLKNIKAISFDLDDTLYDNMPYIHAAEAALRDYIAHKYPMAKHLTQEDWLGYRRRALKDNPSLSDDIGRLRITTLAHGFKQAGMSADSIEGAVRKCFDFFYYKRSDFVVPNKERDILKQLSLRVPLAAITNGNVDCEAIGIAEFFSSVVHASATYPMKPARSMFDYTAKTLNISPEYILHVGDDLTKDVAGATDAGYQSAWLAVNRPMLLNTEPYVQVLPHVHLSDLSELLDLLRARDK